MDKINEIFYKIKYGPNWFIRFAILLYILSYVFFGYAERKEYKTAEERDNAVLFAGRMVIASLAIETLSVLCIILPVHVFTVNRNSMEKAWKRYLES